VTGLRSSAARAVELFARRPTLLAAALAAVLTLGFFNPIFRADATFADVAAHQTAIFPWAAQPTGFTDIYPQSDQADTYYPWQVFLNRSLRDGELPLWNPYSFGGAPFLTNGQSGVLYPPRVALSLVASPSWVHDLFLLLHVFASGVAMFALLRTLGAGIGGALLGEVAWMFAPFTFAWIQLEHPAVIAAWLPLAVMLVHRGVAGGSVAAAAVGGAALALCLLGGNLALVSLVYVTVLAYAALLAVSRLASERRDALPAVGRAGLAAGVAVALPAAVLLPTALAAGDAGRAPVPYAEFRAAGTLPFRAFVESFRVPPLPATEATLHTLTFVGAAVAFLALAGLVARGPAASLGRWLGLITLLVVVGTPLTRLAYDLLPGFEHFRLGRGLFLWAFALALLAAAGLDLILRWDGAGIVPRRVLAWGRPAFAVVAIGLAAAQLLAFARSVNPPFQPRDPSHLYPRTPAIRALERLRATAAPEEPLRLLPLRRSELGIPFAPPTMYASHSMMFELESAAGYESLVPDRIVNLWRVVAGEPLRDVQQTQPPGAFIPSYVVPRTRFDLLPRLGVTSLLAPPDVEQDPTWQPTEYAPLTLRRRYAGRDGQVFEIAGVQPRARVVQGVEIATDQDAALRQFTERDFDGRSVILEDRDARRVPPNGPPRGRAAVKELSTNSERYVVDAPAPGWLVVSSMWAPGWTATVDGEDTPVHRANYALRAVRVDAGRSVVELRYRPEGFAAGAAISLLTLLALVAVPAAGLWRRRGLSLRRR
jgi:hypothetical protein